MALIKEMLGEKVISGFRGVLDFYYYMGLAVVRSWPRKPKGARSPAVMSTWAAFSTASREWLQLSDVVRRSYEVMASGTGLSGRDVQVRAYLKGLYRNPLP